MSEYAWSNLIYGKNFNTPEKKAALEEEINRLLGLINDFTVKKTIKIFLEKSFSKNLSFQGKR